MSVMLNPEKRPKFPFGVIPFYICYYFQNAVYNGYFSLFLVSAGVLEQNIGYIMAFAPIVGMLMQSVWGQVGDRMKYKNILLSLLTFGSAVALLLGGFVNNTLWGFAIVCAYMFFQSALMPLMDAITLEALDKGRYAYGPVRAVGTVSYMVASYLIGLLLKDNYAIVPYIVALFLALGLVASFFMPRIEGHQHGKKQKTPMTALFKNKTLMILIGFTMFNICGFTHCSTYFSLYFKDLGATSSLIGLANFLGPIGEIIFLPLGDKIFKKTGAATLTIIATSFMAVRALVIGITTNLYVLLITSALFGWCSMMMNFGMIKFINMTIEDELKASGQMLLNMASFGVAKILGSLLSSVLVSFFGMRIPFFFSCGICLLGLLIFVPIIMKNPELRNAGKDMEPAA